MEYIYALLVYFAAGKLGSASSLGLPTNKTGSATDLASILNLVYLIAGILAVIVIIISGISYSLSGGDASKVAKAKNALLYSVIGLAVVAFAFVITLFVVQRFE